MSKFFKHQFGAACIMGLPRKPQPPGVYNSLKARNKYLKYYGILKIFHCQICDTDYRTEDLELHHLIPRCVKPDWQYYVPNMMLVCHECHLRVHNILEDPEEWLEQKIGCQPLAKCRICCYPIDDHEEFILKFEDAEFKKYHRECFNQRWTERVETK